MTKGKAETEITESVTGEELHCDLGTTPVVDADIEHESNDDPDRTPDQPLLHRDFLEASMNETEVYRQHEQDE